MSNEIQNCVPNLIAKSLKQQLLGLQTEALKNTLPIILKDSIKEYVETSVIATKIGSKVKANVCISMGKVTERLDSLLDFTQKNADNITDLEEKIKTLNFLHNAAEVFKKANAEGEKWEKNNPESPKNDTELKSTDVNAQRGKEMRNLNNKMKQMTSDDEPPQKRLKVKIPTPPPLRSIHPDPITFLTPRAQTPPRESNPPRDERKGKGIANEEEQLKEILPLLEQSGSDPKILNLQQFSTGGKEMTLEEAQEQLRGMKRLVDLKAAEEKSKRSRIKINIQAQVVEIAEYEAKRAKILEEYNHYLTIRADPRTIIKINYTIDRVTKNATMKVVEIHALASKGKGKSNDTLLSNLSSKFNWIQTQAGKLGLSPPTELTAVGLNPDEKKIKRTSDIIKEVFVKENIRVHGMERNLEEFHLATTSQLIKLQDDIQRNSPEAEDVYKKLEFAILVRDDANEARIIGNEDPLSAKHQRMIKGLTDGKASSSNLRDIQVKYIVKEVKDYLKTYSPAEMDIRCKWNLSMLLNCLGGKFYKDKDGVN
ncbi:hypothetical protein Tco_0864036 [Tanacetum coccineum]